MGADPLSVTGVAISSADAIRRITVYGLDFKNAIKERDQLRKDLERLESLLRVLGDRFKDIHQSDPCAKLLYHQYAKTDDTDHKIEIQEGELVRLEKVLTVLEKSVKPTTSWKKHELYVRSVWHFKKKDEIKDIDTQITNSIQIITLILSIRNDGVSSETLNCLQKFIAENRIQASSDVDKLVSEIKLSQQNGLAAIETVGEQTGSGFETLNGHLVSFQKSHDAGLSNLQDINKKTQIQLHEMYEERRKRDCEAEDEKLQIEKSHIMTWLSPLSFIAKKEELYAECYQTAGTWLWRDPRFQAWTRGSPWFLECCGALGVGKTVLSSILSHRLPAADPGSRLILSIFLDNTASRAQTQENIIGSLLKQIIQLDQHFVLPKALRDVYRQAKILEQTSRAYKKDIQQILIKEFERHERIFIILDGFDEIVEDERQKLREKLLDLSPKRVSLIVTSRPVKMLEPQTDIEIKCDTCHEIVTLYYRCEICEGFDICYGCWEEREKNLSRPGIEQPHPHPVKEPFNSITIDFEDFGKEILDDIEKYVRHEIGMEMRDNHSIRLDERLASSENPNWTTFQTLCHSKSNPNLPEQIVAAVTAKSNGQFLHAKMHLESLKRGTMHKTSVKQLERALKSFPDEIEDVYEKAMHRIEADRASKVLGFDIIGLVARARRALKITEVQHALAILDLSDNEEDFDDLELSDWTSAPNTLLNATSGLVMMENDGLVVRLVHESLERYVRKNWEKWIPTADSSLAKACLELLKLFLPSKPCSDEDLRRLSSEIPFLEYAAQFWGDHVRDALSAPRPDKDIMTAALDLIANEQRLDMCIQVAWATNLGGHDTWDVRRHVDKLHVCAWYGLSAILSHLEPDREVVDSPEPKYGQTPLMYACRKGHVEITGQLVALGASLKRTSTKGRTALFEAIDAGHRSIVELLLELQPKDININAVHTEQANRTALLLATRNGRADMVSILLRYPSININQQDAFGMTAVYIAVKYNYHSILELLLQEGASLDIRDFEVGRSPLRCAAERGYVASVELLLYYGAQLHLGDHFGATAMLEAVKRGRFDALDAMMKRDADFHYLSYEDHDKQTLLHVASKYGALRIVRHLLKAGLNPDVRDWIQRTPIHLAAQGGHSAIIAILLENGADPAWQDSFGETAKSIAWQYGHKPTVDVLARAEEQNLNRNNDPLPQSDANLPIWALARRGLEDLLAQAIISRPQELQITEPGSEDSPLHCAVDAKHTAIVSLLLASSPQDVNKPNHVGRTPLMIAVLDGSALGVVRMLLAHQPAPDLTIADRWGCDTLGLAYSNWVLKLTSQYSEIMFLLIEAGAILKLPNMGIARLFFAAVDDGRVATVKIILDHGFDRTTQNGFGLRASQIATAKNDVEMMQVLDMAPTTNFGELTLNETSPTDQEEAEDLRKTKFVPFRARPVAL